VAGVGINLRRRGDEKCGAAAMQYGELE